MKRPNLNKSTIGEVLAWCAQMNGKVKSAAKQEFIAKTLSQETFLDRVRDFPWTARSWADKAFVDIQSIGVTEGLELNSKPKPAILTRIGNLHRACRILGLYLNKVNGRHVITRQRLSITPSVKLAADLPPSERGNSSPEFGFKIDQNAKLHA